MTVKIGNNDECVQCGESKAAIKESQRKGEPFYCCITDYYGEVSPYRDHPDYQQVRA